MSHHSAFFRLVSPKATRTSARFGRVGCLVVGLVAIALLPVHGQQPLGLGRTRSRTPSIAKVFLPVPRELKRELDRSQEDIKEGRYVDAITRLDLILRQGADRKATELAEDYFLPPTKPGEPLRSLKFEAERVLGAMPAEGLQAYELAHGTDARQQLNAAINKRDMDAIAVVARNYRHTLAGQEATMLLGRERLANSQFLEAEIHLRRLASSEAAAKRFGGELAILLAVTLQSIDQVEEAVEVLKQFRESNPNVQLKLAGKRVAWFADDQDPNAWLTAQLGKIMPSGVRETDEWLLPGGATNRNAITNAEMPLANEHWAYEMARTKGTAIKTELDRHGKAMRDAAAIPVVQPLVVGDWILLRTVDELIGTNFETEGACIWNYPWGQEGNLYANANNPNLRGSRMSRLFKKRVWSDTLYGQLSSDGKSVYLLKELNGDYFTPSNGSSLTNELVALDPNRQGYTLWRVGGPDASIESDFAGVFFLGVPLPVGERLYCVAEQNGEIRLLVLDKSNGKLLWSQQLAQIETRRGFDRSGSGRRMAGINLCIQNNVLVCSTSVGGVVAVDVERRALMWGFQYPKSSSGSAYNIRSTSVSTPLYRQNAALINDGKVLLMPWDSKDIFCLDLLTGESVWKNPQSRGTVIYCGGIYEDKVILVSKRHVIARDLDSGEEVWKLSLRSSPSGIGILAGAEYLLATSTPEVIRIDLNEGKIVDTTPTDEPLGNLVVAKNHIISQNEKLLRAFYQRPKLDKLVTRKLATKPNDAWALEYRALLLLDEGKRDEALDVLRRSIASYPNDASGASTKAKDTLVQTVLEMLRTNHPRATQLAAEIEPLIETSEQRNDFDRMMTVNLRREGRYVAAFEHNLRLLQNMDDSKTKNADIRTNIDLMKISKSLSVRSDRWHRAMFRDLWNDASDQQRKGITALITDAFAAVSKEDSTANQDLLNVLQDIPPLETKLIQELSAQVFDERTNALTETKLLRLARSEHPSIAARATALLARAYKNAGRNAAAIEMYRELTTKFGDIEFESPGSTTDGLITGSEFVDLAMQDNESIRRDVQSRDVWKYGAVKISPLKDLRPAPMRVSPTQKFDTLGRHAILPLEQPNTLTPAGLDLVFDNVTKWIQGRDATGKLHPIAKLDNVLWRVNAQSLRVRANGHYMVAVSGEGIVAIDALATRNSGSEAVLWQDSGGLLPNQTSRSALLRSINFGRETKLGLTRKIEHSSNQRSALSMGPIGEHGVVLRRYSDLLCLDPLTGDVIWKRDDVDLSGEVWGDDQFVFVQPTIANPQGGSNVRVFSTLDGTEHASRPLARREHRVRMFGRHVLTWHYDVLGDIPQDMDKVVREIIRPDRDVVEVPEKVGNLMVHRFQLTNLLEPRSPAVWTRTVGINSKAKIVGENDLAIYDPDNERFQLFSLITGELIVESELKPSLDRIDSFDVDQRAGLYIVTLEKYSNGVNTQTGSKMFSSPNSRAGKLSDLEVHAFGSDGTAAWGVPAKLKNFVALRNYAREVPILVYVRRMNQGKRSVQSVVLDARDGHVIHADDKPESLQTFHVRGERDSQEIRLRLPSTGGAYRLTFTDEPRSPTPPYGYHARTTREASQPFDFPINFIKTIAPGAIPADLDAQDLDDLFK